MIMIIAILIPMENHMNTKAKSQRSLSDENIIRLEELRKQGHSHCMAFMHPDLKLDFSLESPRILRARIEFTNEMTSFNGMVHGGLQSFLIDQAMTCALMGLGIYGATCDLSLRYRASVRVGSPALIRVWVESRYRTIYKLKAEILQSDTLCTEASARFLEQVLAV
jgi:acyl-coenzyme A thioesterase PaaI-like protein